MSHAADRPTIPEVLSAFAAYKVANPVWGSMHIVLDDYNLNDCHVDFCIEWARQHDDPEGERLATILRSMSKTQRKRIAVLTN